jgi:hypothetical protein
MKKENTVSINYRGGKVGARLTKNEMNTKLTLIPIRIVLKAGTHQGMLAYSPVHPNQNDPITRHGPANIAPKSLSSGGGNPFHFLMSAG